MFISPASYPELPAKRIISLVPSVTELLAYLDLDVETIGITKFCVHPQEWFRSKTRIGGTKKLNIKKIAALRPQLIIANKEENVKEQVELLAENFPVYLFDVSTYSGALSMIKTIGMLTGKEAAADRLAEKISDEFENIKQGSRTFNTAYLIWKDPYMTVGGDTFISVMLEKAGFKNIYADQFRYPIVTLESLSTAAPELILLSSEPFPFKDKHIKELKQHFPDIPILAADGQIFSWYGSRMLYAPGYFDILRNRLPG